ncbi:MAG: tetratricopeptide repeat protein [Bacteroidetes bacterium]|jgi:tetratricopeptide (TPR) repeat protein|nr:tetratricopeptide repeat protein [Bacteroidota bacterium]
MITMRGLRFLILLTFFLISISLSSQINYNHFISKGQTELQQEKYVAAIKSLNTAVRSKKDAFEAYFLRGIAKFSLGDYRGAVADFTKTVKLHPLYSRAYQYRGISYDRLLDYAHAISDYDKALEIDPFNHEIFLARGDTKMHLHDYEGAIEDFTSSLNIKRNTPSAWLNRGVAKHLINKNEQALEDINKAINLDYFNVDVWVKRGMIKYELDSLESALVDYNHAIKLDDDNPFVYFQRALTNLKLKDTLNTISDYYKVLDYDKNNALTYYNLAIVYGASKKYEEAIDAYNQVSTLNPFNVYAYYNRASIHFMQGRYMEAQNDLNIAIDIFPDFAGAYINRSAVRNGLNDKKGALEDKKRAEQIIADANDPTVDLKALYMRYADSAYFNKIIEFEADFVNGDMQKGRVQFDRINIVPKSNFHLIYAFNLPDSLYMLYKQYEYYDENISAFNADNNLGIRFVFTTREWPVSKDIAMMELERIDSTILISGDTAGAFFLKGTVNGMLQNYSTAINAYDNALDYDPSISYAYFNRGTLQHEMDEFIYSDMMYTNSITVSRSSIGGSPNNNVVVPTHNKVLNDYAEVVRINPSLPYVYYNMANVKLSLKKYQRAIDDYSMAIKLQPNLAEAYYNRALTLLYVNEPKLACKDLSKAGELGLSEAYNVIKRYCNK